MLNLGALGHHAPARIGDAIDDIYGFGMQVSASNGVLARGQG
jgi:hypothetical protein